MGEAFDAIVVGGGPAGSTAAWTLARADRRPLVLDAARFPRVKLCAGWVTRRVMRLLEIDPAVYPWTIQPFSRATLELPDGTAETSWPEIVSYGIVRAEFDDHLLRRAEAAGARVLEGVRVRGVTGGPGAFVVETEGESFRAPVVIGAGGHGCPVARAIGDASPRETVVVTRESETRIGRERLSTLAPRPGVPELFPEPDFRGYGWYFSKGDFLNVGIGALDDGRGLHQRTRRFLDRLRSSGRLGDGLTLTPFRGHAYVLRALAPRRVAAPGVFLAGDAAGLAREVSGEGIGPAVESGLLAADAARRLLEGEEAAAVARWYAADLDTRFGAGPRPWQERLFSVIPPEWTSRLAGIVCRTPWLRRRFVFEGAFGMGEP